MISVIIVNFHSAGLTQKAVSSVLKDNEDVEIFVVDNSCSFEEKQTLTGVLKDERIKLICNSSNVGFANACNQAFAMSKGEHILLLNPDAYLIPPCLSILKAFITNTPNAGAVSPQVYWDSKMEYYFPHYTYPSPAQDFLLRLSILSQTLESLYSLYKRKKNLDLWMSLHPQKVANLHGGVVLLNRAAIEAAGGLFDEQFFMFYEDTDLFLRLKRAGYSLYIMPDVKAVHNYCHRGNKLELMSQAASLFYNKHFHRNLFIKVSALTASRASARKYIDYGMWNVPPVFSVPAELQSGFLFEWSPSPIFIPSIGCFGKGNNFVLSTEVWNFLDNGQYYSRLMPEGKTCINYETYRWSKTL